MGPRDDAENPRHTIKLSAHYIGRDELTNAKFAKFVAERGYTTDAESRPTVHVQGEGGGEEGPASWRHPQGRNKPSPPEDHPVVQVSWRDAREYCAWVGLRLPTEAEWERALVYDSASLNPNRPRRFAWGDEDPNADHVPRSNLRDRSMRMIGYGDSVGQFDDGFPRTAPVGSFKTDRSPIGALDMTGNVTEWCQDVYDREFYKRSPARDPVNLEANDAVVRYVYRGSSWNSPTDPTQTSSTLRREGGMAFSTDDLGFRVARDGR